MKLDRTTAVALALILPMVAMADVSGQAATTAMQTLAHWAQPVIEATAIILLIVGILAAAFEFFKRSIGWALGIFVGSTVIFAVLWALAPQASSILQSIATSLGSTG